METERAKPIGKGKVTVTKNKTITFDEINQSKVIIKILNYGESSINRVFF